MTILQNQINDKLITKAFNSCFKKSHQTILVGGGKEPLYHPSSSPTELHKIIYRHDFFASALHETAHWCIAGKERRKKVDFGYFYQESRSFSEQEIFCKYEAKPQALESIFHDAIGSNSFTPSLDGVHFQNNPELVERFSNRIILAKKKYLNNIPSRAKIFVQALSKLNPSTKKTSKKILARHI